MDRDYDPLSLESMAGILILLLLAVIVVLIAAVFEIALIAKTAQ